MFGVYVMSDDRKFPHILSDIYIYTHTHTHTPKTNQSTWNTLIMPMTLIFFYEKDHKKLKEQ